jgi:hypothetical protein
LTDLDWPESTNRSPLYSRSMPLLFSRVPQEFGGIVLANVCTLLLLALAWANLQLLSPYLPPLAWALLCALALFPIKRAAVASVSHVLDFGGFRALFELCAAPIDNVRFVIFAWQSLLSPSLSPILERLVRGNHVVAAHALAALLHLRMPKPAQLVTPVGLAADFPADLDSRATSGFEAATPASTLTPGTTITQLARDAPERPLWLTPPSTPGQLFWAGLWAGYTLKLSVIMWRPLLVYALLSRTVAVFLYCWRRRRVRSTASTYGTLLWQALAYVRVVACWTAVRPSLRYGWSRAMRSSRFANAVCTYVCRFAVSGIGLDSLVAGVIIFGAVTVGVAASMLAGVQLYREWTTEAALLR